MDRIIVYPGQAPRSLDMLQTNRNTMVGLGMALSALVGSGTIVDGLAIVPTAPASLQVQVGQGAIYSQQQVDPLAYSSLPADTADMIVKQGTLFGTTLLTLTPPAASGQSQIYLVEAAFQENDGGSVLLPYYNASAPAQPWQGPNNAGTSQFTLRQGQCVIALKAGIAAPTGSQTAPSPDPGYVGLYTITVANGATAVTSANIATLATAPFLGVKLPTLSADSAAIKAAAGMAPAASALTALQTLFAPDGQCRLVYSYSNTVTLMPWGGNQLVINGVPQTIQVAGVAGANTGLAAGTLYYVYAQMVAGALTLQFSTTGHAAPDALGRVNKTGDSTQRLVGMVVTGAGGVFQDTPAIRGVASFFNRRNRECISGLVNASSTSTVLTAAGSSVFFLSWPDEAVWYGFSGSTTINVANYTTSAQLFVDGIGGSSQPQYSVVTANWLAPVGFFYTTTLGEGFHSVQLYCNTQSGTCTYTGYINAMTRT